MDKNLLLAKDCADFIKAKIEDNPVIGIVLGSGLGPLIDTIQNPIEIGYKDIPNFPVSTVEGHEGKLVFGTIGGKKVLVMKGRFHLYEGYDVTQVVIGIRVFKLLGIESVIVTNAAGGINKSYKPGDLMIIKDHISFFAPSPLRGRNIEDLGPRFPTMCEAYTPQLIEIAKKTSVELGMELKEGIYAYAQGPMYETPAEIRALAILGADAVGMSTVPEVIAARHAGMNVLGISCITNMAAGVLDTPLDHEEVMRTANAVKEKFTCLVEKIIENF